MIQNKKRDDGYRWALVILGYVIMGMGRGISYSSPYGVYIMASGVVLMLAGNISFAIADGRSWLWGIFPLYPLFTKKDKRTEPKTGDQ